MFGNSSNDIRVKVSTTSDNAGLDKARRGVDDLDGSSRRLDKSAGALGTALAGVAAAAAAAGVAATVGAVAIGIRYNSSVEKATVKLNAFMKDNERVAKTLDWVKREAANTQFSFIDLANAAADLTPAAKTSGKSLEELVQVSEILAALRPAEGLTGAAFALREALSGDFVSVVERFNLPRQRLKDLREEGVPAIDAIRIAMQEMGVDMDLVTAQGQTLDASWDKVREKFEIMAGDFTKPIFDMLKSDLSEMDGLLSANEQGMADVATKAGGELAGAIGTARDAFQKWYDIMKPTIDYIRDNEETMTMLQRAVQGIGYVILTVMVVALTLLTLKMAILKGIIEAVKYVFELFGAAIYDNVIAPIQRAVNTINSSTSSVPEKIRAAFSGIYGIMTSPFTTARDTIWGVAGSIGNAFNDIKAKASGFQMPKFEMPRFHNGVQNFGGGLAMVGDVAGTSSGEIVHLPQGSSVYSNRESKQMLKGMGGVTVHQNNTFMTQYDSMQAAQDIGFTLAGAIK